MDVSFVELEAFTSEVLHVADEETLLQFEAELAANPEGGDLIQHSGGLRKGSNEITRAWQKFRSSCHLSLVANT